MGNRSKRLHTASRILRLEIQFVWEYPWVPQTVEYRSQMISQSRAKHLNAMDLWKWDFEAGYCRFRQAYRVQRLGKISQIQMISVGKMQVKTIS